MLYESDSQSLDKSRSNPHVSELLGQRDAAALEKLIEWYRPLLRAMADRDLESLLRSKTDASDIVQDTCKDVALNFSKIEANNRFQFVGYLRTALKHKIEDVRRRFIHSQKRNIYREQPLASMDSTKQKDLVDNAVLPIDVLLNRELCIRLLETLSRMPLPLQKVLRWRFRKGMTYKQIGDRTQRSEVDARMLINRCLARMKLEVFPDGWSV